MEGTTLRPAQDYLDFLRAGRFVIQRSRSSGRHVFYPRLVEPGSGADDLEWVDASGRGTIYAVTVQRNRPPAPDGSVVLVDLAEGPRMLASVGGIAADQVRIGMAVQARVVPDGEPVPHVIFEPVA